MNLPSGTQEIELKLLFDPAELSIFRKSRDILSFSEGRARQVRLRAVYFDTPDLVLSRNGMALRVRREKGQWVQTLKGQIGGAGLVARRLEINLPVSGPVPDLSLVADKAVRKKILELCKGQELTEICQTDVRRVIRDLVVDDCRIEMVIDTGSIRSGSGGETFSGGEPVSASVSEVELELKAGPVQKVLKLVRQWNEHYSFRIGVYSKAERGFNLYRFGVETGTAEVRAGDVRFKKRVSGWDVAALAMSSAVEQLQRNAELLPVLGEDRIEILHQYRIAIRRLRTVLGLLDQSFPKKSGRKKLAKRLKALQRVSGVGRDWDVLIAEGLLPLLEKHAGDAEKSAALRALLQKAEAARHAAYRTILEGLQSRDFTALLLDVTALVLRQGDKKGEHAVSELWKTLLNDRRSDILYQVPGDILVMDIEALHELRLKVKTMRYSSEFFASFGEEEKTALFIRRCKKLQGRLGSLNDTLVADQLLGALREPGNDSLNRAIDLTLKYYQKAEARQMKKLGETWQKFCEAKPFWKK
ncbi:CYTH and CHAD domain-containing protein [Kiloniella sp. b19]|uniref:CYTH and CHAD domain-containing protein n=1 Tax=Kiloniella sp. GXU_MW_B19 TaxID=3141326 RepID=UPI0031D47C7C